MQIPNRFKKIIILVLIFYFLILMQASFLVHFSILGIVPNLVFIFVIFINILNFAQWQKFYSAIVGGFYLDIFSLSNPFGFFGFYTLTLIACYFFIKIILEKYVRFSFLQKK
jgi:rod shape-determining protein MreD